MEKISKNIIKKLTINLMIYFDSTAEIKDF